MSAPATSSAAERRALRRPLAKACACLLGGATLTVAAAWTLDALHQRGVLVGAPGRRFVVDVVVYRADGTLPPQPTQVATMRGVGYERAERGVVVDDASRRSLELVTLGGETRAGWPFKALSRGDAMVRPDEATAGRRLERRWSVLQTGADGVQRQSVEFESLLVAPGGSRWAAAVLGAGGVRLPVGPLWGGLAGNTALGAAALGMLLFHRDVRRWRRARRGRCMECGYVLAGLPACAECGAGFTPGSGATP